MSERNNLGEAKLDALRLRLATSEPWQRLVGGIPVMVMARCPVMRLEEWTLQECAEVSVWAQGGVAESEVPDVLDRYVKGLVQ